MNRNSLIPDVEEGGVYSVPCRECNKVYFGETIKTLDTRISQHKYDISRYDRRNAIYRHSLETNHAIDWTNAKFLFNSKNKNILQMVESALISRCPNFNLASGFFNVTGDIATSILHFASLDSLS